MPNAYSPYELGQLDSFSSSANVSWSDGTGTDSISKYQLNEDPPIQYTAGGTGGTGTNEFTNVVDSTVTSVKTASAGAGIVTTKTLQATDTLKADVDIGGSSYSFTHKLGDRGKYSSSGSGVTRSVTLK
jgi:hypothetical protein